MKVPVTVPDEIAQACDTKRPAGLDESTHEVPRWFEPNTETVVATGPDEGVRIKVDTPLNVVVAPVMLRANDPVTTRLLPVARICSAVVDEGALLATARESKVLTLPPGGGVIGLLLNPPVTPDGNPSTSRFTGELNTP